MQSIARITLSLFLLTSAVTSAYLSSVKLRRDGVLNLYPFPRVGRASHQTWEVPIKELYLDSDLNKRHLYAFPRVGRSGMTRQSVHYPADLADLLLRQDQGISKRESETAEEGMWFGPRLGRSFRSEDDGNIDSTQNDGERNEPGQIEIEPERRKRQTTNK